MEIQAPKHMPKHSRYSAAAAVGKRDGGRFSPEEKTYVQAHDAFRSYRDPQGYDF